MVFFAYMARRVVRKIPRQSGLATLEREVRLLRSAVVGLIAQDPEGAYRPEFVRRMLGAPKGKTSEVFKDAKTFLQAIDEV